MKTLLPRRVFLTAANDARVRSVHTTINPNEIAHFSKLSSQWWDERGEFSVLHRMNPVRMQYLLGKLREVEEIPETASGRVLEGLDALDIGCGGGLMSESLARLGARTLGVDASSSNIAVATLHSTVDPSLSEKGQAQLRYRHGTSEDLVREDQRFDLVCSMEVLEHVDNPSDFLRSCCELVKPGGHLFLSTIARTPLAYFLTIFMAEKILGAVSSGTHTYDKFVKPSELLEFFRDQMRWFDGTPGRLQAEARGIIYLPWGRRWELADRGQFGATECNYMFWARKPRA